MINATSINVRQLNRAFKEMHGEYAEGVVPWAFAACNLGTEEVVVALTGAAVREDGSVTWGWLIKGDWHGEPIDSHLRDNIAGPLEMTTWFSPAQTVAGALQQLRGWYVEEEGV